MNKIDFTRLSQPVSNALDTDYMDIYRQVTGNPDRDLIADNIKCHIAIKTSDNPDPASVDVQPKIVSLRIHCNNDYIVAKRCDLQGNVIHYYSGIIGEPAVSMARQSVNMIMSSLTEGDEPLPPPPPVDESVTVTINYLDELEQPIRASVEQKYKKGSNVVINPLSIDNYTHTRTELDGETVQNVEINNISADAVVNFYYQAVTNITSIRMLVYGDYTKDSGDYAYGWHLYASISVLLANGNTLKLASNKFNHEEMGIIEIKKGDKFRDNLDNWHIITDELTRVDDGYIITFADTQEPSDYYVTHWYEV